MQIRKKPSPLVSLGNGVVGIQLTQNKVAVVDFEDAESINKSIWHYATVGYAARRVNGHILYMHQEIMGPTPG